MVGVEAALEITTTLTTGAWDQSGVATGRRCHEQGGRTKNGKQPPPHGSGRMLSVSKQVTDPSQMPRYVDRVIFLHRCSCREGRSARRSHARR